MVESEESGLWCGLSLVATPAAGAAACSGVAEVVRCTALCVLGWMTVALDVLLVAAACCLQWILTEYSRKR
jgi:hypothetical protein